MDVEILDVLMTTTNETLNANVTNFILYGNDSYANSSFSAPNGTQPPWYNNWDSIPYERSGYTQAGIVALGFFITLVMIMIVVGNLLVCIAISTEKSLKTVQNWFIASLAVSDLLLGLVIMPFSLAYELMGYWIFGDIWCEVHHALDVLLCTASTNNLCLISLDRYWSVTQAVEYLKKRTPSRALFMICFVWIFSACVSLPPLVGWKGKEEAGQCSLSDDLGYVLYSAFGSFFIPAIVMVFVYARIFVAARSRARRHVKKKKLMAPSEVTNDPAKDKSTTTTTCTSMSNPSPPEQLIDDEDTDSHEKPSTPLTPKTPTSPGITIGGTSVATPVPRLTFRLPDAEDEPDTNLVSPTRRLSVSPNFGLPQIVVDATPTPHTSPTKHSDINTMLPSRCRTDTDKTVSFCSPVASPARNAHKLPKLTLGMTSNNGDERPRPHSPILKQNGATTNETRFMSGDGDSDCVDSPLQRTANYGGDSNSAAETRSFLTPTATTGSLSRYASSLSIADYDDSDICDEKESDDSRKKKKKGNVQYQMPPSVTVGQSVRRPTPSDAERHKRKIAKQRERRATFILGLIMVSFISAWLPFFSMYLIQGICKDCTISPGIFTFAFWIGYCNSAINPIIYTVFNRDFRKAFRKILFR